MSLPGSTATPEPLRFSTFWPAFWRVCAGADGELGELLAVLDVLVEPQLERVLHEAATTSFTASREVSRSLIWPWNCGSSTAPKARKQARVNTSSDCSVTPVGSSAWMLDEALHRFEEAVAQARFVGAAGAGRESG